MSANNFDGLVKNQRTIMAKRLKSVPCIIEALPDEMIAEILNRLDLKDAVKTCTQSRRLRNIWKMRTNVDLDFTNTKYDEKIVKILSKNLHHLDHIRIDFRHYNRTRDINHVWIDFANEKRVRHLDLHYFPPAASIAPKFWDRLTTLSLKSVTFENSDVIQLLSNSPNLETLLLDDIRSQEYFDLEICNVLKLKRLEIHNCNGLIGISVISTPNLESFKYTASESCYDSYDNDMSLYFEETPKLVDIYLGGPLCSEYFRMCVPDQLQRLCLDADVLCDCGICDNNYWKYFPKFKTLKQLELRFSSTDDEYNELMGEVHEAIKGCPFLEKLTLKYEIEIKRERNICWDDYEADDQHLTLGDCLQHECLKVVEILGWSGLEKEVSLINQLIHFTPLQVLKLDPTPPHKTEPFWHGIHSPVRKFEHEFELATLAADRLIRSLHNKLAKIKKNAS